MWKKYFKKSNYTLKYESIFWHYKYNSTSTQVNLALGYICDNMVRILVLSCINCTKLFMLLIIYKIWKAIIYKNAKIK